MSIACSHNRVFLFKETKIIILKDLQSLHIRTIPFEADSIAWSWSHLPAMPDFRTGDSSVLFSEHRQNVSANLNSDFIYLFICPVGVHFIGGKIEVRKYLPRETQFSLKIHFFTVKTLTWKVKIKHSAI